LSKESISRSIRWHEDYKTNFPHAHTDWLTALFDDRKGDIRVARWYIFKPKIPVWVLFVGLEVEKMFMVLWNILWLFRYILF
jgi:hypothetical protein